MKHYRSTKLWLLFLVATALFGACTETFEEYNVDMEQEIEVIVESQVWNVGEFTGREYENTASGDTASFRSIIFDAYDDAFPWPQHFTFHVYLSEFLNDGTISTNMTQKGLVYNCQIEEVNQGANAGVVTYKNNGDMPLPPTFDYTLDSKRRLLSGVLAAKLYSNTSPTVTKTIRVRLSNYRYK